MKTRIETVTIVGVSLLIMSFLIGIYGYQALHENFEWMTFIGDYYANISAELGSIAITVIVIDQLNRRRDDKRHREEKESARQNKEKEIRSKLTIQLSSRNNALSMNSIKELRERGWLTDGSIIGADLSYADLSEADLFEANLSDVILYRSNLYMARLYSADLRGANLRDANLYRANTNNILMNSETILPNGDKWSEDIDLRMFTSSKHPQFWQPNWIVENQS